MNAAIVGCGLIGRKRAASLEGRCRLTACADRVRERANALASQYGAEPEHDWRRVVERPDVDLVIVATLHDSLAEVACAAAACGKHVLVEKPGARRAEELAPVAEAAARGGALVRVGYNHRYHPALRKARELVEDRKSVV